MYKIEATVDEQSTFAKRNNVSDRALKLRDGKLKQIFFGALFQVSGTRVYYRKILLGLALSISIAQNYFKQSGSLEEMTVMGWKKSCYTLVLEKNY